MISRLPTVARRRFAHPERISALALVAPGLAGYDGSPYTEEQGMRYEAAEAEGHFDAMMDVDFEVWAPLGADERMARLWYATPDANPLPEGVFPRAPAGDPAVGAFRCSECGYGVTVLETLPSCPMCRGTAWEPSAWSPFVRAARQRLE